MDVKESNRLKEFRQLKKEIRGSEEHLVVGIDIARINTMLFWGRQQGKRF